MSLMHAQRARAVILVGSRSGNRATRHALRDVYPPLTTVRLPLKRMGEMPTSLVLTEASAAGPRLVPVPGEVRLRESTLPRPHPNRPGRPG